MKQHFNPKKIDLQLKSFDFFVIVRIEHAINQCGQLMSTTLKRKLYTKQEFTITTQSFEPSRHVDAIIVLLIGKKVKIFSQISDGRL